MKLRTIITQDAEVDDQNSLRHFLFYANEVELQGIVQTSSKFHWRGVPGAQTHRVDAPGELIGDDGLGRYDSPYRWPGTDWMFRVIDDYEKDYPNLCRHAEGYPTPDYLRSIIKIGNVGYKGEVEAPTEGSELIRAAMLDEDPRPLYLQVWGGCNTIVRALMDIQAEYAQQPDWPERKRKLTEKIIITACGEQDETYRSYLAEQWPGILFVKTLQMLSYAYPWPTMPEGESKDTLRADFMKREILNGKSALTGGYRTWLDGVRYPGEEECSQFGANPNIGKEWFGARFGMPGGEPFDFLSEGDSPTFFLLLNWGFRTLENFSWGGIAGRYERVAGEYNTRGEALNLYDTAKDVYIDRAGNAHETESMWGYVADIQRDFAARVAWAGTESFDRGEHAPTLEIVEGLDHSVRAGAVLTLHARAQSPDGSSVKTDFRSYREISPAWAADAVCPADTDTVTVRIPVQAKPADTLHLIVRAKADGYFGLVHYQHVTVTVR